MKFVECKMPSDALSYKRTKNQEFIDSFIESGVKCAEVKDFTHKTVNSCASSLHKSVNTFYKGRVLVVTRKGHIYLINLMI